MKLGNKGFAISTIMYMILILALVLTFCNLAILSNRNKILSNLKSKVQDKVNVKSIKMNYICKIKSGNGNYDVGDIYNCSVSNTESYNFYVISTTSNDVNLVMSMPLTFDKGNYNNELVITKSKVKYNNDNSIKPNMALTVLKTITDNWFYLDNRSDIVNETNYSIDYTGYKARLLTFNDIKNYINVNTLTIEFISDTLTSSIYNNNLIYSVSNGKVIVSGSTNDEYSIVPVITVSKGKIKN